MPAAMHRHAVDPIDAEKEKPIFRSFAPGGVVGKGADHFHIHSLALQKFAESDVVGRNSRDFRRVVYAPNDYAHLNRSVLRCLGAAAQLVRFCQGEKFVDCV